LWASDIWFLNDAAEVRFAQHRMVKRLSEHFGPAGDEGWLGELLDIDAAYQGLRDALFVTCFSEDSDLLGQWRAYAANGFAIGFAVSALRDLAARHDARFLKVDYGAEAARPRLRRLFEDVAREGPYESQAARMVARTHLAPAMASVKESSFADEREWRLLLVDPPDAQVRFRTGAAGTVPYVEIPLADSSAVRQVVVGPGADRDLRRRAIGQLLIRHGYADICVRDSES